MVRPYVSELSLKHKCLIRHFRIPFSNAHKLLKALIAGVSLYILMKIKGMLPTNNLYSQQKYGGTYIAQ
jgi:hypothetical protein